MNTFYAFVSAVPADIIKARRRRIEEAINRHGLPITEIDFGNPQAAKSSGSTDDQDRWRHYRHGGMLRTIVAAAGFLPPQVSAITVSDGGSRAGGWITGVRVPIPPWGVSLLPPLQSGRLASPSGAAYHCRGLRRREDLRGAAP